jgi:hypothetical protein
MMLLTHCREVLFHMLRWLPKPLVLGLASSQVLSSEILRGWRPCKCWLSGTCQGGPAACAAAGWPQCACLFVDQDGIAFPFTVSVACHTRIVLCTTLLPQHALKHALPSHQARAVAGPEAQLGVFDGHSLKVVPANETLTFAHTYRWWGECCLLPS